MSVQQQLRVLWVRSIVGELTSDEVELLEQISEIRLRAWNRPNEATIGHKILNRADGTTLARVRRDFDRAESYVELVTSNETSDSGAWSSEIEKLDEAVRAVEDRRRRYDVTAGVRPDVAAEIETGATGLSRVLAWMREHSTSNRELGARFERLMKAYLKTDPLYAERFSDVWLWSEWPDNGRSADTGIDLVARERDGGYCAIQCKFYDETHVLAKQDIDSFFTASGKAPFTSRIIISTTDRWGKNAENALADQQVPVARVGLAEIAMSPVEWPQLLPTSSASDVDLRRSPQRQLLPHQREAVSDVLNGFATQARGQLIMACGTGKTFTSLRVAESLSDPARSTSVLFLAPSISLVNQTLREWTAYAEASMQSFAVCSDPKVGRRNETEDIAAHDLMFPATTDAAQLLQNVRKAEASGGMTVIFATYQSIETVAQAQRLGLPSFDLVICDEAHRTTGVTLAGEDASHFVKVHDNAFLSANRRLYMTATPRLYDPEAKAAALEGEAILWSMDDETTYGPVFHRLGFGRAVDQGLLTDYKVLILNVDERYLARSLQSQVATEQSEIALDDAVKIIGCWNGLAKRSGTTSDGSGFGPEEVPMSRAVAFSRSIRESKKLTDEFKRVLDAFDDADDEILRCEVRHVDGTYNALQRNAELNWLKAPVEPNSCRILSNARCLSEGVDVPDLDAVLFLNPRNSVVDVVQSVGRVMRKAVQKQYGYIILPIGVPGDMTPSEALSDNKRYKVVWQVLQALRAHDDRFHATVNQIDLNRNKPKQIMVGTVGFDGPDEGPAGSARDGAATAAAQLALDLHAEEWREAVYAKIVTKVGERTYWEDWARDVAKIAERHVDRISALITANDSVQPAFEAFLTGLRGNLNDSITPDDAVDMLAQHMITRPIFEALFEGYDFAERNPVSIVMQRMLDQLDEYGLDHESESLGQFYASVRVRASGIDNAAGKQRVMAELYEKFFRIAFPRVAASLGIVYTPVEIVDFIVRSVHRVLRDQFGVGIGERGVHVLDPFTGTGTFIVRLLQTDLMDPADLHRKYEAELHANEILLLAYYIAAINIEATFHELTMSEYAPFTGIVLTDTFQMSEADDTMDELIFPQNNERVAAQKALDIRVVVGNPPYSVGQDSQNDDNTNLAYPTLDQGIRESYANKSSAVLKRNLYDSYIRAFRWASDRIGTRGVVSFVSNGTFIDRGFADGFRKSLSDEFTKVYVLNLRGDARTSGEQRRKERDNVFGQGTRTPVAITILVKDPQAARDPYVHYYDIGDYLTRAQKLSAVDAFGDLTHVPWQRIEPNAHGDWLNQRNEEFSSFQILGDKQQAASDPLFEVYSYGLVSNRDAWVYNFSRSALESVMARTVEFFNDQVAAFTRSATGTTRPTAAEVDKFISRDATSISWSRALKADVRKAKTATFDRSKVRVAMYRPYCKQWLYFDRQFNEMVNQLPRLFPTPAHENRAICVSVGEARRDFSVLMTDVIPDLHLHDVGTQVFPLYTYVANSDDKPTLFDQGATADGYQRNYAIGESTLQEYRRVYGDHVTTEDIFYYVYGLLHSPDYRTRFGADLSQRMPRIPKVTAFQDFVTAGRTLASLHLGYETADPWPLEEIQTAGAPDSLRIRKMRFAKTDGAVDRSQIVVTPGLTLRGIPLHASDYRINGQSALEWVMDRYELTVDKASGISNDPNAWGLEHDNPNYVLDLLKRLVTVSVATVELVSALPAIEVVTDGRGR